MDDPFFGIQAKLDRSEEHFDVLDDHIGTYLRKQPYSFAGEEHTEGDYYHWSTWMDVGELPPDEIWGPIIGDVVHNLRSALDHLAWQLATEQARADTPRRIEFPIFLDDPANDPDIRRALTKILNCLRPESHAVIDAAQPYKTGNTHHPLWLLQALWNTDKHRTLHTAGFLFGDPTDAPPDGFGFGNWSHGEFNRADPEHRTPLANGHSLIVGDNTFEGEVQGRVDAYKDFTVDVSLGPAAPGEHWWTGSPFAGLPIRQMLRRIREYVDAEVITPLRPLL